MIETTVVVGGVGIIVVITCIDVIIVVADAADINKNKINI